MHEREGYDADQMKFRVSGIPTRYVKYKKDNTKQNLYSLDRSKSIASHDSRESLNKNDHINGTKEEKKGSHKDQKCTNNPCSLFPAINKSQFIPDNDQFIPLLHDPIRQGPTLFILSTTADLSHQFNFT
ncbi:hypothetical protein MOSE0_H02080 [Monosporozyma servazzii]